ncbi:glycan-binding surface protein [Parapedobacter pyrenivorans]|uniref:glycan-binding surface protein n=1 Tax=Parapedobacter pyrenivorans TaxID=1305674 RepID=UPI0033423477
MKSIYKQLLFLTLATAMTGSYMSCSEDSLPNNGNPRIRYVRITDPLSADSLLIGAGQGNLIAIIGENLGDAREIWFNDQQAVLTTTYITNTTILVSVPSQVPLDITNRMKIVFAKGNTLEHEFEVQISEPFVNSINNEYALPGEVAIIRGNYFYEPLTVTFTGGAIGELVSVEDDILQVRVPSGAEPGPITVASNFGQTPSDFWFRDNRNIILSSDPFTGWWNAAFVVSQPAAGDPPTINGNYIRVTRTIGAWAWTEVAGGPADAMGDISKNIPDEAILKPENYYLKFEVNTLKPYNNNMIKFNFGLPSEVNDAYQWAPPFDTKGQWQTVSIPYEAISKSYKDLGVTPTVNPNGYWTRILIHGPGDWECDIAFDNFRIVPKVDENKN